MNDSVTVVGSVVAAFAGVLLWSFLEYCIHRWLGHDRRFRPNLFAKEHVRHHIEGDYFAPWWKKAAAALIATVLLGVPSVLALGFAVGGAFVVGFVAFYLTYEVLHRLEHAHAGLGAYGRWARRHHFSHHFCDARFNHGVTSPLWDIVFRTYRPVAHIAVPERLVMKWLVDPVTDDVRTELADFWSIKRPRARAAAA